MARILPESRAKSANFGERQALRPTLPQIMAPAGAAS